MYFAYFSFYLLHGVPRSPTSIAFLYSVLTAFLRSQQDPGKENSPFKLSLAQKCPLGNLQSNQEPNQCHTLHEDTM